MSVKRKKNAKLIDTKVKILLIVLSLFLLMVFGGAVAVSVFAEVGGTAGKWLALITGSVDVLSIFLMPVLSIWFTSRVIRSKNKLEEDLKIEPDHHKIICQYKNHSREFIDHKKLTDNMCNYDGVIMSLCNVTGGGEENPVKNVHSDEYFERQRDINLYKNGRLLLPSTSVFTNTHGATITFDDSTDKYELPSFLQENAAKLFSAHKASNVSNGSTIRLNDFTYENSHLTLKTQRSDYIQMLMTNRCMDFDIDGMSVRSLYEHGGKVSLLKNSKLCNQIGINGLVYTNDDYLLIEKRGRKKAVWKNKFAQPISLALKLNDVKTNSGGIIGSTPQDAEECFKNVISKTLRSNFGLVADSTEQKGDYRFNLKENFMGIARDLLEGGKPNLYFYVNVDMSADQLKRYLEANSLLATRISDARIQLGRGVKSAPDGCEHETHLSQIDDKNKEALKNLLLEGYLTIAKNGDKYKLELTSVTKPEPPHNTAALLADLDKMVQSTVDSDLGSILAKKLPKINKDKLDSKFYLIKRKDIALDYHYAAKIPVSKVKCVQRKFFPYLNKLKAHFENARAEKPHKKYLHYECGEALLASLYYAATLDLENRIENKQGANL